MERLTGRVRRDRISTAPVEVLAALGPRTLRAGLQADLQVPLPVLPIAPGLSRATAESWKLTFGRTPVFGARSADGRPSRTEVPCDRALPVSVMMGELHARRVEPVGSNGDVTPLVLAAGLERSGSIAKRLRAIATHTGMPHLLFEDGSRELVSKYLLMELFAETCDGSGRVRLGELRKSYGPDLDRLIGYLGDESRPQHARIKQHEDAPFDIDFLDPHHSWLTKPACSGHQQMFGHLVKGIVREELARRPRESALHAAIAERYGAVSPNDSVILRQHALGSNAALADLLAPRRKLIGKDYSSAVPVMLTESVQHGAIGADVALGVLEEKRGRALMDHHAIGMRGDLTPWYKLQGALVREGLLLGHEHPMDHFQLIDEGAAGILLLNELVTRDFFTRPGPWYGETSNFWGFGDRETLLSSVSAVEGTRDGARQLAGIDLSIPVINAAESPLKLRLASVLIAWSVVEEVERALDDLRRQGFDPPRHVLVAGYGSVGSMVAELFRELGYQVTVKETDDERRATVPKELDPIAEVGEESPYGFVVGCVGKPALTIEEMKRLRSGTLLFSASSSTKEFPIDKSDGAKLARWQDHGRDRPIVNFAGHRLAIGSPGFHLTHWHRALELGGKELMLMNSGFPINLTGHPDPIEPVLIELIRALVQLASYQARALPEGTVGLIPLDAEGQRFIAEEWMKTVRALEPPLPAPVMKLLEAQYVLTMRELETS